MGSLGCLQIVLRMQSVLVSQADALANKITLRRMFGLICHRKKQQLSLRAEVWVLGPAFTSLKADPGLAARIRLSTAGASGLILDGNKRTDRPLLFISASSKSFFFLFFLSHRKRSSLPSKVPWLSCTSQLQISPLGRKLPVHPSGPGQAEAPQGLPSSGLFSEICSL